MADAARKHGGRRHAGQHRRRGLVWALTAALLATSATVALWPSGDGEGGPGAAQSEIGLGADTLSPDGSEAPSTSGIAEPSATASPTLSPGTSTPAVGATSDPTAATTSTHAGGTTRTSAHPAAGTTSRTRAGTPPTSTSRPSTRPTSPWRGTVRPCKSSCVIVRNWFETGTQGWAAPAGGTITPVSPGYRDSSGVRASGVTTTAGPSLTVPDLRLSGPDRRWVSVRVRVRVTDAGGARLRLRVDGAAQVRMRELAADGDWQILRAWFLPQGPVKLTVVAAPSRCSGSPRLTGVYLDDVLATVLQPGEEPYGVASPYVTCW